MVCMDSPKAISFEIRLLSNLVKRKMDESLFDDRDDGVTGMHGWVIGYLKANADQAVYQRDIERDFNIRRATVTGVLQLMERHGLIERKPVRHDARLKQINLTPKAYMMHERIVERFNEFEHQLHKGLSEEEVASFFAVAEKLKKNLE